MSGKKLRNLVKKSIERKNLPDGKNKHFTFLFKSGKPIAFGHNCYGKTHTRANRLHYRFNAIHSELACILKADSMLNNLDGCTLINIRINRFGDIRKSMPCCNCMKLIRETGIKTIWFTTENGEFEKIKI